MGASGGPVAIRGRASGGISFSGVGRSGQWISSGVRYFTPDLGGVFSASLLNTEFAVAICPGDVAAAVATTPEQRNRFELNPHGIHWEALDEDISVDGPLAGRGCSGRTLALSRRAE